MRRRASGGMGAGDGDVTYLSQLLEVQLEGGGGSAPRRNLGTVVWGPSISQRPTVHLMPQLLSWKRSGIATTARADRLTAIRR